MMKKYMLKIGLILCTVALYKGASAQSYDGTELNRRVSLSVLQAQELNGTTFTFTAYAFRDGMSELLGANVFETVLLTVSGELPLRARSETGRQGTLELIDCIGRNGGSCLITGTAVVNVGGTFDNLTINTPELTITEYTFGYGDERLTSQQTLDFFLAYRDALDPVMSLNGLGITATGSVMHISGETYFVDFGFISGALVLDAGYANNNSVRTDLSRDGVSSINVSGSYELLTSYSEFFPLLPSIDFVLIDLE